MVLRMKAAHGVAYFKVAASNRFAALVKGHGNFIDTVFEVGQVGGHSQNGHQLGTYGDAELALHGITVETAA